jgi:hypothetical protein
MAYYFKNKNYKLLNKALFEFLTKFKVAGLKLSVDIEPEDLL